MRKEQKRAYAELAQELGSAITTREYIIAVLEYASDAQADGYYGSVGEAVMHVANVLFSKEMLSELGTILDNEKFYEEMAAREIQDLIYPRFGMFDDPKMIFILRLMYLIDDKKWTPEAWNLFRGAFLNFKV